jgi:hypothetical protein
MKIHVAAGLEPTDLQDHPRTFVGERHDLVVDTIDPGAKLFNCRSILLQWGPPGARLELNRVDKCSALPPKKQPILNPVRRGLEGAHQSAESAAMDLRHGVMLNTEQAESGTDFGQNIPPQERENEVIPQRTLV